MAKLSKRLAKLTARDVMSERLVVLNETDSIQHAANLFREQKVSGAPVVDAAGQIVGLLSTTDIIPAIAARLAPLVAAPRTQAQPTWWDRVYDVLNSAGPPEDEPPGEPLVNWMSRKVVSVGENTPFLEVARKMSAAHIHRLVVIDAAGRPRGIVSTLDVLEALVEAVDKANNDTG